MWHVVRLCVFPKSDANLAPSEKAAFGLIFWVGLLHVRLCVTSRHIHAPAFDKSAVGLVSMIETSKQAVRGLRLSVLK